MTSHDRDGTRRRVRLQRARAVTTALAGGSVIGVLVLADLAAHSTPARASAGPSTPSATPTGSPGSTPATGATQPAAADPTTSPAPPAADNPTTSPTTVAPATNPAPAPTPTTGPATTPVSSAPATSPATSSPYIQSGSGSSGYASYSPPVPSYSPTPVRSGAS
ncbi:MAG: hypothetical protein KGQ66_10360 [Acidobacteriota bacterium]|nr:hypothetical protein [Acidobacteriota bacterium]